MFSCLFNYFLFSLNIYTYLSQNNSYDMKPDKQWLSCSIRINVCAIGTNKQAISYVYQKSVNLFFSKNTFFFLLKIFISTEQAVHCVKVGL